MKYQYWIGALIALFYCSEAFAINKTDMVKAGIHNELATIIDNGCKTDHCKVTASFISWAESSGWNTSKNAFGFTDGTYVTHKAAFDRWNRSYSKYWYKTKDPSHFYANRGVIPKTHYCMSEHSSNSKLGCPNGRKNAFYMFNKLKDVSRWKKEGLKDSVVRQWAVVAKQATTGSVPRPPEAKRKPAWRAKVEKFLSLKY